MLRTPTELELEGNTYRIGNLDAMRQFHVARRLGPLLASLGVSITSAAEMGRSLANDETNMLSMMAPIMDIVAKMPDDDVEYIINTCLSVVHRKHKQDWAPVLAGTRLVYQDIGMTEMVRLTVEVVKECLGGFFSLPLGAPQ